MKIISVAHSLPSKKVSTEDLIAEVMRNSHAHLNGNSQALEDKMRTFFRMAGTKNRFHRADGEKALDFAIAAGNKALKKAGLSPLDIDLLIYAGVGRGWLEPATANLFQSQLGLKSATCFDVLDACASWIRSMSIAQSYLKQGAYKRAMVLNCELNFQEYGTTEIKQLEDLDTLFSGLTIGEAATATIIEPDDKSDAQFSFRTWGEKHNLCKIPLPNIQNFTPAGASHSQPMQFFTDPGELLSFTIKKLVSHYQSLPAFANQKYDLLIGHSVSVSSTATVARMLRLDESKVFEIHSEFGNTVSASLPLALSLAEDSGRLKRGMKVLLVMGSAGVTTAFYSFTY